MPSRIGRIQRGTADAITQRKDADSFVDQTLFLVNLFGEDCPLFKFRVTVRCVKTRVSPECFLNTVSLTLVFPLYEGVVQMSRAAYLGTKVLEHCAVETMTGYTLSAHELQAVSVLILFCLEFLE